MFYLVHYAEICLSSNVKKIINFSLSFCLLQFSSRYRIVGVAVSPNWGATGKLAVSVGEDRTVRLWDMQNYVLKLSHRGHTVSCK